MKVDRGKPSVLVVAIEAEIRVIAIAVQFCSRGAGP